MISNYIPKVIEEAPVTCGEKYVYAEVLLQLNRCHTCNKVMFPKGTEQSGVPFPSWYAVCTWAQAKAADWRFESEFFFDDEVICTNCATAGRAQYTCYMCQLTKLSGTEHFSIGSETTMGRDRICTTCFETKTAKEYYEAVETLQGVHFYDNE